jgi:hypothetical protein
MRSLKPETAKQFSTVALVYPMRTAACEFGVAAKLPHHPTGPTPACFRSLYGEAHPQDTREITPVNLCFVYCAFLLIYLHLR